MPNVIVRSTLWRVGLFTVLLLVAVVSMFSQANAEGPGTPPPLATLVPPTLVPPPPPPTAPPPFTQSAIAGIKANNVLRVGILYNIGRFSTLTSTGDVDGFEADIAQAIADDWGVKLEFHQVTRQNALNLLLSGQIDLLMGQVVLSRDAQAMVDYSDPLFMNKQVALVNSDSGLKELKDLVGKSVGVVMGSPSEAAFNSWMQGNNLQSNVKRYLMLDDAIRALINKEVDAVVGDRWELDQRVNGVVQGVSLLNGVFRTDPYAIAMRRYDDNLRTLVDRTLQRLVQSNRFDPIYDLWFPKDLMPVEDRIAPRVWKDLDTDSRAVADFATDIVMPEQPVIAKITAKQPLRVAGLGAPPDATGKPPVLEAFNQALINEMARRWGVQVQSVPNSYGNAEDVLASGQADLAVGIEPHWSKVDRVDFVSIYAQHAYRLMTPFGTTVIKKFDDLFATNRQIGYFDDDPAALDLVKKLADKYKINPDSIKGIALKSDQGSLQVLGDRTANFVFGDSLRLLPIAQANPTAAQMVDGDYGPAKPIAFAVPRNDADFRVLVDVTLQDMYRDGTYQNLWKANFGLGDPLSMVVWPGSSTLFGIKTSN
ncbi:MAG: transporter substrate-binding domain-containing protein [Chloroflexota bacterium]